MPQQITILVVDSQDERRKLVEQLLTDLGTCEFQSVRLDDPKAVMDVVDEQEANIVFIGAGASEEASFAFADQLSHAKTNVGIAIVSTEEATEVVMRAMRSGADEFIQLPVDVNELGEAIKRVLGRKGQKMASGEGQIVTIFSGKGGVGSTMIATNLAINLAAELTGESVVLVDLNLQLGDIATFMDLRPRFTISDAAKEFDRLDQGLLKSFLTQHRSGAFALTCPNEPAEAEGITGEQIGAILKMLRSMFRFVVVDTAHSFSDQSLGALDNSDTILLVTDMLVPSVRNTQRCLEVFKELAYPEDSVKIVINRYYSGTSVSLKELRQALDRPIWYLLPNDFTTVISAIDGGLPVENVAARSEIATSLRGMAQSLAGIAPTKGRGFNIIQAIKSLFGR